MLKCLELYQGVSGYYIVFMKFIEALTLTRKLFCYNFYVTVEWKRGLPRPTFPYENFSPSPTASHTITKNPNKVFCGAKVVEGTKTPEGPLWYGPLQGSQW